MIITGIINLAYSIISWLVSLFPHSTGFPDTVHTALSGLGGYLHILDPIIPTDTLITTVGLLFTLEISIFVFKGIKWLISHIPWIGGKGN